MDDSKTRYDAGMARRRAVLGDEYVEQAIATTTEFTQPLQQLVTEMCWGTVWTRPGLEPKVRSLLNIAMMTALNRPHELALHVRGALRTGCTKEEIQETLLQAAVYAGIPAAVDAFRVAAEVLREAEAEVGR